MNGLDIEQVLDQFEEAWQRSPPPAVENFLPPAAVSEPALDHPDRRELLKELIKVDMEYRWRQASSQTKDGTRAPGLPQLEDYLGRYPAIRRAKAFLIELIGEEYRGRHRWGDRPAHAEYARRFPGCWEPLKSLLARVDTDLAAERSREVKRPGPPPARAIPQETTMIPSDTKSFLATLAECHLLDPAQCNDTTMSDLQQRFPDARSLARDLLQRGWLTPYQVNQVFLGRGRELLQGQYLILERLGDGGMGQVFKARHRDMNRTVAIKIIRKELLGDPESLSRFRREVQMLSKLTHPHVVHAYDAGLTDPTYYLVMEHIEGVGLDHLVKERGPLGVEQACHYVHQAALGLQHIHERGLVHRDIKPGNLIVAGQVAAPVARLLTGPSSASVAGVPISANGVERFPWGVVKIMDLGLGRLHHVAEGVAAGSDTTAGQMVMGTLDYMAPEQALDFHRADIRADIYSLGCTFYFLLTGQVPLPAETNAKKLLLHQMKEPPPLEQSRRDLPPLVPLVVRQMMAKLPEDRYQTPGEVARVLAPLVAGAALPSTALVPVRPTPSPVAIAFPLVPVDRPMVVVNGGPTRRAVERLRIWLDSQPRDQRRWILRALAIGAILTLVTGAWSLLRFLSSEPEAVFLVDLQPLEAKGGNIGKQGVMQLGKEEIYPVVGGRRSAKGLIALTLADGIYCQLTYRLGKRYRVLNTAVSVNDTVSPSANASFRFSVIGDGKILWESQPVRKLSDIQQCEISVAGVDQLQLGVVSQGRGVMGALWCGSIRR